MLHNKRAAHCGGCELLRAGGIQAGAGEKEPSGEAGKPMASKTLPVFGSSPTPVYMEATGGSARRLE